MEPATHEPFEPAACPWCGASPLRILGVLGNRAHFRCRYCGADCSGVDVSATRAAVSRAADITETIERERGNE
jgi:hypothetical protein